MRNVVCRVTFASLLPVIFATTKQLGTPVGLEVCTPSTWKEIRSVSCWPRCCLSSWQQQSSWALTPRVPCGLEVCTPSTWRDIRSVSYWFWVVLWCVAWRPSPRYCLSSSQQQGSWALAPRVPCGLEVCTPSTWKEIRSVSCWFHAECGLSLLPITFATTKAVGHLLLASRVVLRFARPTCKEIRSVSCSCGMWCVAWRLSPRHCLSSSQQQSSWALTPRVPCGLEVCTPSTWKEIRSVSCWFHAECGVSLGDFRLATACHLRNNKAVVVPCGLEVCTPSTWKETA